MASANHPQSWDLLSRFLPLAISSVDGILLVHLSEMAAFHVALESSGDVADFEVWKAGNPHTCRAGFPTSRA